MDIQVTSRSEKSNCVKTVILSRFLRRTYGKCLRLYAVSRASPRESSLKSHLRAFKSETYAGGPSPKTAQDDSPWKFRIGS